MAKKIVTLVNQVGQSIGEADLYDAHRHPAQLHLASSVWLIREVGDKRQVLFQKRSANKIVVWDGYGVVSVSILMYLHKTANNWRIVGEEGYEKPNFGQENLKPNVEVSVKPASSAKTTKHEGKRKKERHEPNLRTHQQSYY